jgi:hypothetical protein
VQAQWKIAALTLLVIGGAVWFCCCRKSDKLRRDSIHNLESFSNALQMKNSEAILKKVALPRTLRNHTIAEQTEFLTKALQNEISESGIEALKEHAAFGPLSKEFPNEAGRWAEQAGVKPEDCVAFKMQRDGVRAEVVLVHEGNSYRILRCNNVKQMAGS